MPTLHENEPAQLSVWRDISARKQSERLISKQNTSLEYAQQVAQIGSIEIELSSGRAEWSKSASEMLGVDSEPWKEVSVSLNGRARRKGSGCGSGLAGKYSHVQEGAARQYYASGRHRRRRAGADIAVSRYPAAGRQGQRDAGVFRRAEHDDDGGSRTAGGGRRAPVCSCADTRPSRAH